MSIISSVLFPQNMENTYGFYSGDASMKNTIMDLDFEPVSYSIDFFKVFF